MDFTQILRPISQYFSPSHLIKKPNIPFVIMILSPHPDDESITSSLPLRLMHENNAHIINVAVTLGSKKERQKERSAELEKACAILEFENVYLSENWTTKTKELKSLIQKYQPDLIMAPHLKDFHPTHIKTGELIKKALPTSKSTPTLILWSEFWGALPKPNLLVEVPEEILALQMKALAEHKGEVARNPYHLRLPAWMMENVRRGSELIAGKGAEAPRMPFGVLYQLQLCHKKKFKLIDLEPSTLTSYADIGQIFRLILDAAAGSKTKVK